MRINFTCRSTQHAIASRPQSILAATRRSTSMINAGTSMTYTYAVLNRLASAKDNRVTTRGGPSTPTIYGDDPAGNLSGYAYANLQQTGNIFDSLNRLTQTCTA